MYFALSIFYISVFPAIFYTGLNFTSAKQTYLTGKPKGEDIARMSAFCSHQGGQAFQDLQLHIPCFPIF